MLGFRLLVFAILAVVKATASTPVFLMALVLVPAVLAILLGAAFGLLEHFMAEDDDDTEPPSRER